MKRERATSLLTEMIDRLKADAWPLNLITEVYVFGSYPRGSLAPNDVDLVVQHGSDEAWSTGFVDALSYGKDPYTAMKQGLRGRRRGLSFQFQERDYLRKEGFELTLLWQRGEPLDQARQRLAAMPSDPAAGPAPRDHMLPCFEGLEQHIPRPARIELHQLHTAGKVTITALALPDATPSNPRALQHLRRRWSETSPLRRAATTALAQLEAQNIEPGSILLHRRRVAPGATEPTHFVDLGWHSFRSMTPCLHNGLVWLEVLRPHPRHPLHALQVTPADDAAPPAH